MLKNMQKKALVLATALLAGTTTTIAAEAMDPTSEVAAFLRALVHNSFGPFAEYNATVRVNLLDDDVDLAQFHARACADSQLIHGETIRFRLQDIVGVNTTEEGQLMQFSVTAQQPACSSTSAAYEIWVQRSAFTQSAPSLDLTGLNSFDADVEVAMKKSNTGE